MFCKVVEFISSFFRKGLWILIWGEVVGFEVSLDNLLRILEIDVVLDLDRGCFGVCFFEFIV